MGGVVDARAQGFPGGVGAGDRGIAIPRYSLVLAVLGYGGRPAGRVGWGDRWCEGGMGRPGQRSTVLGSGLGSLSGRCSTGAVVVQTRPWRGPGRSCRGQGTEGERDGALTGSTLTTGCQIGGHEKSRPDSKCKTVWP